MRIYYEIIFNNFDKSKSVTILEIKQNYFLLKMRLDLTFLV